MQVSVWVHIVGPFPKARVSAPTPTRKNEKNCITADRRKLRGVLSMQAPQSGGANPRCPGGIHCIYVGNRKPCVCMCVPSKLNLNAYVAPPAVHSLLTLLSHSNTPIPSGHPLAHHPRPLQRPPEKRPRARPREHATSPQYLGQLLAGDSGQLLRHIQAAVFRQPPQHDGLEADPFRPAPRAAVGCCRSWGIGHHGLTSASCRPSVQQDKKHPPRVTVVRPDDLGGQFDHLPHPYQLIFFSAPGDFR